MTVTEQRSLTASEPQALDAYWRAANYLSVGQIYLLGNPLPRPELLQVLLERHDGSIQVGEHRRTAITRRILAEDAGGTEHPREAGQRHACPSEPPTQMSRATCVRS